MLYSNIELKYYKFSANIWQSFCIRGELNFYYALSDFINRGKQLQLICGIHYKSNICN